MCNVYVYVFSHAQFLLRDSYLCALHCSLHYRKSRGRILCFLPDLQNNSLKQLKIERKTVLFGFHLIDVSPNQHSLVSARCKCRCIKVLSQITSWQVFSQISNMTNEKRHILLWWIIERSIFGSNKGGVILQRLLNFQHSRGNDIRANWCTVNCNQLYTLRSMCCI